MRAASSRRPRHEEEEESVFVSMTDMTVSFLFIVILLLAFFASRYDDTETVPLPIHETVVADRHALRTEVAQLSVELETTQAALSEALEELARLRPRVEQQARRIRELEELVTALRASVSDLEQENLELREELARLKAPDPLEEYINQSMAERRRILEKLRDQLKVDFPELDVILSEESDALRFQGDGLFRSGQAFLRQDRLAFIETVADRLDVILPCYTLGPSSERRADCNAGFALIEAVQIEGHTDGDGDDIMNLALSTDRANATFRVMTDRAPGLTGHLNFRSQPVLSVAGYGKMRPIAVNDTTEGKAANRRIDLRIIMYVPVSSDEIATVRAALTEGEAGVE